MKKLVKWPAIILFIMIIVFSFSSCRKDSLDGTSWKVYYQDVQVFLRFNNQNFRISAGGQTLFEGTYSISGVTVSMSETLTSENRNNVVFIGALSGNILSVNLGYEIIEFTKRHWIFG